MNQQPGDAPNADRVETSESRYAPALDEAERNEVERRMPPRAAVLHEAVGAIGEEELKRTPSALTWSGLAAGLSMGFSMVASAALQAYLPDVQFAHLVVSLGYSTGFVIVIMARQQLFTENTVTVVLPVAASFTRRNVLGLARMWAIVFAANMIGTAIAALFCNYTPVIPPELRDAMYAVSREMMANGGVEMFFKGIAAGFLIATMVWLIPSAEGTQFHVIAVMTYLIAVGGFTHIVAGSVEAFLLVVSGQISLGHMLLGFTLPVLCGNVVGGTALFALLSYAQVMREMETRSSAQP